MSIKIYRDNAANAIFIEDANGVQFLNSLQASVPSGNNVTITDLSKQIDLVANTNHVDFVDENDDSYGATDNRRLWSGLRVGFLEYYGLDGLDRES